MERDVFWRTRVEKKGASILEFDQAEGEVFYVRGREEVVKILEVEDGERGVF